MKNIETLNDLNQICQKPDYKTKGNWMARNVVRDAALPFTWLLLHTPITANQVTVLSILIIIVSSFIFSIGTSISFFTGALLLEVWYLMDHIDGQIARYRKQESITGVFLDYISHYFPHLMVFPFIAIGLLRHSYNIFYLYMAIITASSLCLINLIFDAKYKSFFWAISRFKVSKIREYQESSGAKVQLSFCRKLFSWAHKICEIHVIMNILFVLGLMFILTEINFYLYVKYLLIFYAFISSFVCILRISEFILTRRLNKEFFKMFE
jgi:phosphatidylglycerophosphate synthase